MVMEDYIIIMEIKNMKVILIMINLKEKEHIITKMIKFVMKVNGLMVNMKEMENYIMKMVNIILVNLNSV